MNTIPVNGKQPSSETFLNREATLCDFASRQSKHLVDRFIEIEAVFSRRRFFDVVVDPVDDDCSAIGIANDTTDRFPDLAQVWRVRV